MPASVQPSPFSSTCATTGLATTSPFVAPAELFAEETFSAAPELPALGVFALFADAATSTWALFADAPSAGVVDFAGKDAIADALVADDVTSAGAIFAGALFAATVDFADESFAGALFADESFADEPFAGVLFAATADFADEPFAGAAFAAAVDFADKPFAVGAVFSGELFADTALGGETFAAAPFAGDAFGGGAFADAPFPAPAVGILPAGFAFPATGFFAGALFALLLAISRRCSASPPVRRKRERLRSSAERDRLRTTALISAAIRRRPWPASGLPVAANEPTSCGIDSGNHPRSWPDVSCALNQDQPAAAQVTGRAAIHSPPRDRPTARSGLCFRKPKR